MIEAVAIVTTYFEKIQKAADDAATKEFRIAAARIRKDAIASIHFERGASAPGTPPNTHRIIKTKKGKLHRGQLNLAIAYDANKDGAIIGPVASIVGESGAAHEFGGSYKGEMYPARPFMAPALERNLDRFASGWAGSIGE